MSMRLINAGKIETLIDNIILWLVTRLLLLWDRHNDKIAFTFGRDETTDYQIIVSRYYDEYWEHGTKRYEHNVKL